MAFNLLAQYGIKEVADVSIYKINDDGSTTPFLFLDTLKVSTIEQTAEQSDARGGKGNPKLITWDFGKEINVTLEDALYSPKSMALMWGGEKASWNTTAVTGVTKLVNLYPAEDQVAYSVGGTWADDAKHSWKIEKIFDETGATVSALTTDSKGVYMAQVSATQIRGAKLEIGADDFPGVYKIVGDTYARNRDTGEDEYFQFIIPRAKMTSEQTLTLEAEGDPTTFNLNLTVLRPKTGNMMELVQYTFNEGE